MSWPELVFNELYAEPSRNGIYKTKEFHGDGCKLVNMGELFEYDFISSQEMKRVRLEDKEFGKNSLLNGDLLFGRRSLVEAGAGKCSLVITPNEPTTFESSIIRVRLNKQRAEPRFYFYYFKSPHGRGRIRSIVTGTNVKGIRGSELKQLKVIFPPLIVQQSISEKLSAYDDLIDNNTRRIKILTEMAQRIFREWFVEFRFPDYKKIRLINSKIGKIPEGWKIVTVGDVIDSIESGSRPKGGIDPSQRGIPSIGAENILGLGQYEFDKEKYVSKDFFENMRRGIIKSGDILLYKDGAKIGRKSMFRDGFPHETCCINEHVFILRTNLRCSRNYLYFYLDRPEVTHTIVSLNTNAAQPGINQPGVKSLLVLLPNKELIDLFDAQVEPMIALLFNLAKKNQLLKKKKDVLLPKLITGEIDVSKIDILMQEQANVA